MKGISRPPARLLMLSAAAAVVFIAHGVVAYGLWSTAALPVAVVAGAIALIVLKHLGLLSPLYVAFRRNFPLKDR
jgi:hypothetical protein